MKMTPYGLVVIGALLVLLINPIIMYAFNPEEFEMDLSFGMADVSVMVTLGFMLGFLGIFLNSRYDLVRRGKKE